jgi:dTDP-4-dehydrorhamnose reductase
MRVAVTGPGGRLGRALMAALGDAPFPGPGGPLGWGRPDFDLDDPGAAARLIERDRPDLVIHAAAWTDTEACAREPARCLRRNGEATGELAAACAARGIDLVVVSTNEVFDGRRTDGRGYAADDGPSPINPYGAAKLAGERAARDAYRDAASNLAIVRTAWLYGPPGNDFPAKILAAADRARLAAEPLRVVFDETGSPTFAPDLADAIVELAGSGAIEGTHHVVNAGAVTRAGWARELLRQCHIDVPIEEISASTWTRASAAPAWAVLEPTPLPGGEPLRPWQSALADYVPSLLRLRPAATR